MSQSATFLNWGAELARPTRIAKTVGKSSGNEALEVDPFLELLLKGPTETSKDRECQHLAPPTAPKDLGAKDSTTISPEKNFYFDWTMFLTLALYYNIIFVIFAVIFRNMATILDKCAYYMILRKNVSAETALNELLATLRKASIFRDCNPGLFLKLVLKLRYNGLSPLEYLCRIGDIGKEMYILKQGTLEVVSDDGLTVLATLTKGAVFCELSSILNMAGIKCGSRRTVNVRSVGHSHVFCLQKSDLWKALEDYPEAKSIMLERGDITM